MTQLFGKNTGWRHLRHSAFTVAMSLMLLGAHTGAVAADDLPGTRSGLKALSGTNSEEFLRVEEAYTLDAELSGDTIVMDWTIAPGYYLYQDKFRFTVEGLSEKKSLSATFEPGKRIFDNYFNKELTVYYQQAHIELPAPDLNEPYQLTVTSQGCADAGLCYPPRTQYLQVDPAAGTITETSGASQTSSGPTAAADQASAPMRVEADTPFLPWILLGALLGGAILNLMPCVFPVLSLKALSFASSQLSQHKQHIHGWAYTGGIVASFLLAAVIILVARGAGETVGWGFQLQSPVFISLMVYLFFAMSLSLLGMFQLGTRLMGVGQSLTSGHGLRASFFTGVLAALVASPCTAPFMATALGFAITQPAYVALLVFAALGLGMALPFLLLSYSPALAQRLPKPGPWMEVLKQVLAFPLLLTCIWLLWVLGHQVNSDAVAALLVGATAIAFATWLWHKQPSTATGHRLLRLIALICAALALVIAAQVRQFADPPENEWVPYSAATLAELRAQDTPVFVNLTADWCITCLANDRVALNTDQVRNTAERLGVAMVKGDWTNTNPEITALLKQYGRSGVPLYLMYPAEGDADAQILPQILNRQLVVDAMEQATR